jgi:hypothetical protein
MNAKRLGNNMHRDAVLLAQHLDYLAEQNRARRDSKNLLYDAMKETENANGRLVYYYPLDG